MQAHFNDALLIRKAVISGKIEDVSDPATVIANLQDLDDLPKGWGVFVEHMRTTAARLTNSTTPAAAGAAVADLGVSCGLCHQAHGGPSASSEPAPKVDGSLESRMAHHVWATERLWEGLSIPSGAAWVSGAQAFGTEPFPKEVLRNGGVDARSAAKDFSKLVAQAPTKKTTEQRAALYAELLITCGACHQAMPVKN